MNRLIAVGIVILLIAGIATAANPSDECGREKICGELIPPILPSIDGESSAIPDSDTNITESINKSLVPPLTGGERK